MTQATEGQFNPSFHFLGLIQKAMSDGVVRRCSLPSGPEVFIVPADHAYYSAAPNAEALQALCLAAPFDLTVESVPDWQPDGGKQTVQVGRMWMHKQCAATSTKLPSHPLQELLWYAGLTASRGQLLQGCRADEPVRLKRCPDFSVLPHARHDPVLAACLLEASTDLLSVAEATGIPLARVFDFHNACAVLGLIERGNAFEPQEYLPGVIQRAITDRKMRRCALPGHEPLFLAPEEGKYYTAADAAGMAAYCTAMSMDLEIGIVDSLGRESAEEELVQIGRMWVRRKKEVSAPVLPSRPLSDLWFRSVLESSRGRLLAGSQARSPVRLKRWPDVACLELDRRFFALAAFMTANTASIARIAESTGVAPGRVTDFHNACAVIGLLESGEREAVKARPVADGEREIYRKISRALEARQAGVS